MATVTSTVVLRDPETFEVVVVKPGDELPKWANVTTPGLIAEAKAKAESKDEAPKRTAKAAKKE